MGFSLRVAPGLRIRASGLVRESVLVSGCGRPVFVSTLAGRAYLLVWDRFRSTIQLTEAVIGGTEPARTSTAARGRQLKQAARSQQARELTEAFEAIANVRRVEFPVATAPVVPAPAPTDQAAIRKRHRQEALRGVGVLKRAARASPRRQAAESAAAGIGAWIAEQEEQCASQRCELDKQRQRLLANDADLVFTTLTDVSKDNEAAAIVAGMRGGDVAIVVYAPDTGAVPGGARRPGASVLATWTYDPLAGLGSLWLSQTQSIAPPAVSAKPVA
jgi:hypothetical protein